MASIIIEVLLIVICGGAKALADTISHHFDTSIFKWKDRKFWDPYISWKYVGTIKGTKFHPDAWHLSYSVMIISFCLAVVLHRCIVPWWIELPAIGLIYNLSFNLFYNKIFR